MGTPLFLGLDAGTSGIKAILVDAGGEVRASATSPLELLTPHPGWAEQEPETWWQATIASIRAVLAELPDPTVVGIGISGQMHSSVFLDASGAVIRPALLWCDGRTTAECAEITKKAGGEQKLKEWVSNPARMRWSEPLLEAVGIDPKLLPPVGGSAEVLGRTTREVTALTGLPEGTPVVGGGADNACGAAGVGVVRPGEAVASWGTSGTVLAPTARPLVDPGLRAHTFCHVLPDVWYLMGVMLTAGGAFKWYRDQLARDVAGQADASMRLNEEAAAVAPGADGVVFLPYLQGERTPYRDAAMRGAFLGISAAHTRAHLTRAVLEGIAFGLRDSLVILQQLGLAPGRLLLTGGGAQSPFVRRLLAEIFGLPVQRVNREEGGAYGAALLAAVGGGAFPDLSAAAAATLTRSPLEHPDAATSAAYQPLYQRFRGAAAAARPELLAGAGGEGGRLSR